MSERSDEQDLGAVLAENVKRLSAARGMARAHLADHAGIGRTTMWRLLDVNDKGRSDPRLSTAEALARALDVSPVDLLAGHDR